MKNHSLLNFSAFICAFVVGFMFSARFYHSGITLLPLASSVSAAETHPAIRELGNGQKSFLVITTRTLDKSDAELTSLWLVSYMPGKPDIHILPIYPAAGSGSTESDQQLATLFRLSIQNKVTRVDQDFVDLLKSRNYWWSGYIVLDEQALGEVFTRLPGMTDGYYSANSLLLAACSELVKDGITDDLMQTLVSDRQSVITDLDPELLQQEVETLLSGEQPLTCNMPVAEVSTIVH